MDRVAEATLASGEDAPPLPPPAPREMPIQDLRSFDRSKRAVKPRFDWSVLLARLSLFGGTLALTAWMTHEMYLVLSVGQLVAIEMVMLGLFVINICWISFGAVSTLLGLLSTPGPRPAAKAPLRHRIALLLPVYNEDTASFVGTACATLRALAEQGEGETFDLFVLSDTNKDEVWLAEEAMIAEARRDPVIARHLFYRHRLRNRERKVGNLSDWVERWGGAYEYFVVFDADSLMDAATIIELAHRIEADDEAGLIQTVPRLINGRTVLARAQQFAARVYGPLLARGLGVWFGNAGNYWGHNAIIRTEAFASAAGLPILPGRKPFGGMVMSHDFVEAAMMRRAGWSIVMADDLGGSYEQAPPNLMELVARDRRWCQGNLQHLALINTAGFHPLSRLHLAMGVMSYLASPLWFLFLLTGMLLALHANLVPPNYFPEGWSLFPTWPQIDARRAMMLFGLCMLVLFLPKLLGLVAFLGERAARGLRIRAVVGFFVENIVSALIAPVMMLAQTRSVVEILTGADSGWRAQARDAERIPWRVLWSFHHRHMFVGVVLAVLAGLISWSLLAWMSPALTGMIIAIPLAGFVSSGVVGGWLRRRAKLLVTPEEEHPPAISVAAEAIAEEMRERCAPPATIAALLADKAALERHLAWLDAPTARRPGEADATLAAGWLRLSDGAEPDALTPGERYAVLASEPIMRRLIARNVAF
ncbi:glucans biosynthesis glucosyltransferase MdoH [Amaricoccus solimangrovi]|uniref:Glucans biosynthesis glucosyltransferase H n=1 Tax=Amaricoccus solimangrovi TaxID=2589815 RepID=A0A501WTW1_9RHOB|nr:glucans biosynthesis glucosyltransferase MdoH [Amaricoccus solimangrovi]TPE50787.1 glucans biosynthesis glucosyltransferase MdoH [Amaricoccus solimangrovi]